MKIKFAFLAHACVVPVVVSTLAVALPAAATPTALSHWTFNEGLGSVAADIVGGQDAVLDADGSWSADGISGGSIRSRTLDWSGAQADMTNLGGLQAFTISSWFKPIDWHANGDAGYWDTYPNIWVSNSNSGIYFQANWNDVNRVELWVGGEMKGVTPASLPVVGQWHLLVVTWDGSNLRSYLNGVLADTVPYAGSAPLYNGPFMFGRWDDGDTNFDGLIDEVRIWNGAISDSQVAGLWNGTFDQDADGDGVIDSSDACSSTPPETVVDPATGCSVAQTCPCNGPAGTESGWPNHGTYVSCVARATDALVNEHVMTRAQNHAGNSAAGRSDCGR